VCVAVENWHRKDVGVPILQLVSLGLSNKDLEVRGRGEWV